MLNEKLSKAAAAAAGSPKAAGLYDKALTALCGGRLGEANRLANAAIMAGRGSNHVD